MSDTPSQPQTWPSDLVWGVIIGAAAAYEIHAMKTDKLDRTLTRTTRRHFRTHHPVGKALFSIGWGYLAVWFMRHILDVSDPMDMLIYKDRTDKGPFSMMTQLPDAPWRVHHD